MPNSEKIPERFFTVSDRIKAYLINFPDSTYTQAAEYFLDRYNLILKRGAFYKIRSDRNLQIIDRRTKEDCYRDISKLAVRYGIDMLPELLAILESYTHKTVKEQIQVYIAHFDRIKEEQL